MFSKKNIKSLSLERTNYILHPPNKVRVLLRRHTSELINSKETKVFKVSPFVLENILSMEGPRVHRAAR